MRCAFLFLTTTLAALPAAASASTEANPKSGLVELTYSSDRQALENIDRDISAAGNDATKLAAVERQLLEVLRRSDATYAARQAAAQRLGHVLALGTAKTAADALKPLPAMLLEERDSDLARLALEPTPGDAVDQAFVTALDKTTGRVRRGIIDSTGRRRIASAVPTLAKLLKDADPLTSAAAASALGQIADSAAVSALNAVKEPSAAPVAAAKLVAASRMNGAAALSLLDDLQRNARDPVHRRAAFRLSLDLDSGSAARRIAEVLSGSDWSQKEVALEAVNSSRAPNLISVLVEKLGSWDSPTASAVIALLARRADPAATRVIVASASNSNAEIRAAAIDALGFLPGSAETTTLLAKIGAGSDATDAKAARQSLTRLNGPDVSATILVGAEKAEPATRAVFLEQLALRNMTEGLPLLLKTRADPDLSVRVAAAGALGELGRPSEQTALLDWTIEATDSAEQSRALRSLVNVTLRNPDVERRGEPIFSVIEYAPPELALTLLPALGRIGGSASAQSAARLAVRDDPRIAEAAATALTRWTDGTALPSLSMVAEKAAVPLARERALEGAIRFLERDRAAWAPETTAIVTQLLGASKEPAPRKQILAILHRANDQAALEVAEGLKAEPNLAADAAITAEVIRANMAGAPRLRASTASGVGNMIDGKTSTRWSAPALGEEWIEVEFKLSRPIQRVTLDQTGRAAEYPERYEVFVTDDPAHPGKAIATGTGQRNRTVIELPNGTRGRFLIVKNTAERKDTPWAICELYID